MHDIDVVLAETPGLGRARLCECNSVHLSLGPVTISLSQEAFVQAAALMRNAMEELTAIILAKEIETKGLQSLRAITGAVTH